MIAWQRLVPADPSGWVRLGALALATAWGLFWIWFNVASAFGEGPGIEPGHLLMAAVVLAALVAAWIWPTEAGGLVLLLLAAFGAWFFRGIFHDMFRPMPPLPPGKGFALPRWFTPLILLGPPALAGLVLTVRSLLERWRG